MPAFPILPDFLEEHLWALRDRVEILQSVPLPERPATRLTAVLADLVQLMAVLRRPRPNVKGLAASLEGMRNVLECLEREAWPGEAAAR